MATSTLTIPPPPEGFTMDAPSGAIPPPPAGFTLDAAPDQPASMMDKLVGGKGGRMLLGIASPALAAAQLVGGEGVRAKLAELEASKQRGMKHFGTEGFDAYGLLGSMIPGAAIAGGVTAALPAATSALGRIGVGSAIGAATSAAQPVTNSPDFWTDKAKQVGLGGLVGGAIPAVAEALRAARGTATMPMRPAIPEAQTVYHGSPHTFEKFDIGKVGTGEGAQAYGHGLYFAENPKVAQEYADKMRMASFRYNGEPVKEGTTLSDAVEYLWGQQGNKAGALEDAAGNPKLQKAIRELDWSKIQHGSKLYEANISKESIGSMLDWDKPLSQQSESVRKALGPIIQQTSKSFPEAAQSDMKGGDLYRAYVSHRGGNADSASKALSDAGISGIKYLDEGSRATGQGTHNYTVFNDSLINMGAAPAAQSPANRAAAAFLNPTKAATLAEGQAAGYVVPPSSVNPSFVNDRLESIAGKASVGQEAAKRNQEITNALAAKSLGLPPDTTITEGVLNQVRKDAGKPYAEIAKISPEADNALEALKQARFMGNKYKLFSDRSGDPAAYLQAKALQNEENMIEKQLEKLATDHGRVDLVKALPNARTAIAKSYDVERALNVGSSDINAAVLGRKFDKVGAKGMTGELATIGKMQQAFKSAMREGGNVPASGVSGTDAAATALLSTIGAGSAGPAGILAGGLPLLREPARNLVLSPAYQKFAMGDPRHYQAIIDALAQQGAGAAGTAVGRSQ